jgi:hypothetical protein
VYVWQMVYVFLLSGLSVGVDGTIYHLAHTHLLPPDDGIHMGPKHAEAC